MLEFSKIAIALIPVSRQNFAKVRNCSHLFVILADFNPEWINSAVEQAGDDAEKPWGKCQEGNPDILWQINNPEFRWTTIPDGGAVV